MKKYLMLLLVVFPLFSVLPQAPKEKMIIQKKIQLSPTPGSLNSKVMPDGRGMEKMSPPLARNQGFLPPRSTVLGGTKIKTKFTPMNHVLENGGDKAPKPRETGQNEHDGLICKSYSVSLSPESQSFDAPLSQKMDSTYPGAAYRYYDYLSNNVTPRRNESERNPIILQVSSSSGNGKQELITNPTYNELVAAVGRLKTAMPRQAPNLSTEIYVQSMVNEATFALNVEAGGGGFGFALNASLGIGNSSSKSYMSIDAKQKNYTITANRPDRAEGGFFKDPAENNKGDNIYMSTVTYGRRVIGVIETELDEEHMEVGVQASYNGFGVSANLGLGILDKMSSAKTSVRLLFIGGNGDVISVPNPTTASVTEVINKWMASTSSQAAVPVEYTFRNMDDVGMRWESVTSDINYEQCVPKPPAAAAPSPWDVTVTLNSISNSKSESVTLGIQQFVGVKVGDQWKREASGKDRPIICWMEGWSGCQKPPNIDFRQPHSVGTSHKFTVSHEEYETNPLVNVDTRRIVMYATNAGGSKNAETNIPKYKMRLKDLSPTTRFDVPVHVNHRIFKFNYTVTVRQQAPAGR